MADGGGASPRDIRRYRLRLLSQPGSTLHVAQFPLGMPDFAEVESPIIMFREEERIIEEEEGVVPRRRRRRRHEERPWMMKSMNSKFLMRGSKEGAQKTSYIAVVLPDDSGSLGRGQDASLLAHAADGIRSAEEGMAAESSAASSSASSAKELTSMEVSSWYSFRKPPRFQVIPTDEAEARMSTLDRGRGQVRHRRWLDRRGVSKTEEEEDEEERQVELDRSRRAVLMGDFRERAAPKRIKEIDKLDGSTFDMEEAAEKGSGGGGGGRSGGGDGDGAAEEEDADDNFDYEFRMSDDSDNAEEMDMFDSDDSSDADDDDDEEETDGPGGPLAPMSLVDDVTASSGHVAAKTGEDDDEEEEETKAADVSALRRTFGGSRSGVKRSASAAVAATATVMTSEEPERKRARVTSTRVTLTRERMLRELRKLPAKFTPKDAKRPFRKELKGNKALKAQWLELLTELVNKETHPELGPLLSLKNRWRGTVAE
eukprot:PLAT13992.3.p1 GENE.PLAT13992.3~~PLAT13992.3.p1  ORF type:complete len:498 (+),score=202.33 PLAT13992.3:42-1496(+)